MKNNIFSRGAALALVAVMSMGAAQASVLDGFVNFTGETIPTGGTGLDDATGLTFPSGFIVTNATGSFAANGVNFPDAGSIADFVFNPSGPVDPFITVGDFAFALDSVQIVDQTPDFLVLAGTGTLTLNGLEATLYNLSMSVDTSGGSLFGFSGTLAPVPLPGAAILLLSGLAALGIRRRG